MKLKNIARLNHFVKLLTVSVVLIGVFSCNTNANKNADISNPILIEKINYKGWTDAIKLSNQSVQLVIVPQVGRILHYSYLNQDNLLYVNKELEGLQLQAGKVYVENGRKRAPNIGGDRLLINSEAYYKQITGVPFLSDYWINAAPYSFEILNTGVTIKSPVSELQGVQITRTITLAPIGSKVTIDQSAHKVALAKEAHIDAIPLTLWNLTKIRTPQASWLPLSNNSVFKNGYMIPFWRKAENSAVNKNIAANNIVIENNLLKLKPSSKGPQKVGADARGWVAGLIDDILMVEKFPIRQDASYPDGGTNATLFSNKYFTELECLSPEKVLSIGDSLSHTITWELHKIHDVSEITHFLNNNLAK